ncbi:MAG TPA: PfkB family carbohydrate kinase [Solirubrobacterales bacterium]|nr:PfkB family carbohydrate kinase [Solirubrobacterales bacterium]
MRVAAVGHVEWVEFVRGDHVPAAGEIVHAHDNFEEPAGGGAVAAVQLARLAGGATFLTALGEDELARRTRARLAEFGVIVRNATRDDPTRRALTFLDAHGERTIITIGERLAPRGRDPLDWDELRRADGVYLTAADAEALHAARGAGVLVASPRAGRVLHEEDVRLDALVYSDRDEFEIAFAGALDPPPTLLVATRGAEGGRYETAQGQTGSWTAAPLPGPIADTYGAGDSFAAALTFALAQGQGPDAALALAARAGAVCLTGRGPYQRQLDAAAL